MKTIKYILFIFIPVLISCEDILNRGPLNKISENDVWVNEVMTKAYVTNLYSRIPFNNVLTEVNNWYSWTDEGTRCTGNSSSITQGTASKSSEGGAYWDY